MAGVISFRDTLEMNATRAQRLMAIRSVRARAVRALCRGAVAGLLSLSEWAGVPSPYAALYVLRAERSGAFPVSALCGALCALAFRLLWGAQADVWQYVGCALAACLSVFWPSDTLAALAIKLALSLLPRAAAALMCGDLTGLMMSLASLACGLAAVPLAMRLLPAVPPEGGAADMAEDAEGARAREAAAGCALACALLVAGGARIALPYINLGVLASGLITFSMARARGAAAGAAAGMACGMALALSGLGRLMPACLGFAGLISGLKPGGRVMEAVVYAAGCALSCLAAGDAAAAGALPALLTGGLCTFLLPPRVYERLEKLLPERTPCGDEANYLREQTARWSRAVERIAQSLPAVPDTPDAPDASADAEILAAHLCADCALADACYGQRLAQTREALTAAVRGLPHTLPEGCPRVHQLSECVRRAMLEIESARARARAAASDRALLASQLENAAQAVLHITRAGGGAGVEDHQAAQAARRALARSALSAQVVYARRVDGRLRVALEAQPLPIARWQPGAIAELLSGALGPLDVIENENGYLLLEQRPPLRLMTGSASVSAGTRLREAPCGDAVLTHRFLSGRCLLGVSDGMGHGERAAKESKKALELLALCLEAGYGLQRAVSAVNGMLMRTSGDESYATCDLCLCNLFSGQAKMTKLGACPSYLIREGRVHVLSGDSLPLGIVESVRPAERSLHLMPNDMLVMMTDGASDAFTDADALGDLLVRQIERQPGQAQALADATLRQALRLLGAPRDDMTVLCVSVEAHLPARHQKPPESAGAA